MRLDLHSASSVWSSVCALKCSIRVADCQGRFVFLCQRKSGYETKPVGCAVTYKLLDLGYRPTQGHPQILLLALILNSPEVSQLVLQSCQLAIVMETIGAWRRAMARTIRRRGGRELEHEEMGEVYRAFAAHTCFSQLHRTGLHHAHHARRHLENTFRPCCGHAPRPQTLIFAGCASYGP